jgi:hypothetical protein
MERVHLAGAIWLVTPRDAHVAVQQHAGVHVQQFLLSCGCAALHLPIPTMMAVKAGCSFKSTLTAPLTVLRHSALRFRS